MSRVTRDIERSLGLPPLARSAAAPRSWRGADPLPLLVLPPIAYITTADMPPWVTMWAMAMAVYAGCKWLTWRTFSREHDAKWFEMFAYAFGSAGMEPRRYLTEPAGAPRTREWAHAAANVLLGAILLWVVARELSTPFAVAWCGMAGIVFLLHFGTFRLIELGSRKVGYNAEALMRAPHRAVSVREFWNTRWNTAFHGLTRRYVFTPTFNRFRDVNIAVMVSFFVSGVVHEAVITVPARGGYGLPTLYFLLQGVAIMVERSRVGRRAKLGSGWRGWLFTMVVVLGPIGLLFPEQFIARVVIPFMRFLGAL